MAWRSIGTGQAGTIHSLKTPKLHRSGERLSVQWQRGGLGVAIHWWPSNHTGAERGSAFNGDWAGWELPWRCGLPKLVWLEGGVAFDGAVAGWELPFNGGTQIKRGWRVAGCRLETRRIGGCHALNTLKALWFMAIWWRNLFREQPRDCSCFWGRTRSHAA